MSTGSSDALSSLNHAIFKHSKWRNDPSFLHSIFESKKEPVILCFKDQNNSVSWTLGDHIAHYVKDTFHLLTLSKLKIWITGLQSIIILSQDTSSAYTIGADSNGMKKYRWLDVCQANSGLPCPAERRNSVLYIIQIQRIIQIKDFSPKLAALALCFPYSHARMSHPDSADLLKLIFSCINTIKSEKRENVRAKVKSAQSLYSKLESILGFHPIMRVTPNPVSPVFWSIECPDEEDHDLIYRLIQNAPFSDSECMLEWIEAKISMDGYFQLFSHFKDQEWNDEVKVWDALGRLGERNDIREQSLRDDNKLMSFIYSSKSQNFSEIIERLWKCAELLIDDDSLSPIRLIETRTPLGRSLVMFSMFQRLSIEVSAISETMELNTDEMLPTFVQLLTTISNAHQNCILPLLSSVRYVNRYRKKASLCRGESGWGLTNFASVLYIIGQSCDFEVDIGLASDSDDVLQPASSSRERPQTAPLTSKDKPKVINHSNSFLAKSGLTNIVKGLTSTSRGGSEFFTSTQETKNPTINQRFMNAKSIKELKVSELEQLLIEYQRLARLVFKYDSSGSSSRN